MVSHGSVAYYCISTFLVVTALAFLAIFAGGAFCFYTEDFSWCGDSRNGAIAMLLLGTLCCITTVGAGFMFAFKFKV